MNQNLRSEILAQIKPTESLLPAANVIVEKLNVAAKKLQINCSIEVGGSIAKNTNLKGDADCDIFIRFDFDTFQDADLSAETEKILKEASFSYERINGSRDYFHIQQEINLEIVPVLLITDSLYAKNVTDMSPLHVHWVKERTKDNNLADEVRLAKQFCKAQRVYGAESYINGFSGHVLDILTIHYGGFEQLLKASVDWKEKEVIDTMNFYAKTDARLHINEAKQHSPIIVVDPILEERNAASALSEEKYVAFKHAAAAFLKNPDAHFFKRHELQKEDFVDTVFVFELEPLEGKPDVVGAQLYKAFQYIQQTAESHDFEVIDADWDWGKKAICFFSIKEPKLSEKKVIKGPPLRMTAHVNAFRRNHKYTQEKGEYVVAEEKRAYTLFKDLAESLKTDSYLKTKVKSITINF